MNKQHSIYEQQYNCDLKNFLFSIAPSDSKANIVHHNTHFKNESYTYGLKKSLFSLAMIDDNANIVYQDNLFKHIIFLIEDLLAALYNNVMVKF